MAPKPVSVRVATLAVGCLVAGAPASAQIYSWRDAKGTLVLSNVRPAPVRNVHSADNVHNADSIEQITTYAVPRSVAVRTTRPAAPDRAREYDDLILEHARLNRVRTDLVRAVVQVESAFNRYARSPKGALGLMQLMPATMHQYGVTDAFDPIQNVRAGVAYLRELLDRYQNNEQLALAAYNAGPGAVDRHGQNVPPYRETRNYIAQVNQNAARPIDAPDGRIYKVVDVIDGQPTVRYTDKRPSTGSYEIVGRR